MGNEAGAASSNRAIIIVVSIIAAVVVVALLVGYVVTGIQQREHDDKIDRMVNDRLNSCFDSGDC
ncbi:hypothetical protein [Curtobacterium sp. MCBA15_004]|uniref:hypothetical protein n=1 Tax=Curtobacterium sp. MCBA15_004 TaxID=1898733 RepID=UPI0011147128|nr:hypothetical protein [Curtobacterium sp. MCBA15_004]WIA98022.1 hypothetical protein QOL16_06445 [Curtobacterium sp. MCBA15_004]